VLRSTAEGERHLEIGDCGVGYLVVGDAQRCLEVAGGQMSRMKLSLVEKYEVWPNRFSCVRGTTG
jgi:hypothetical protein